jgi:hypothetical protein
MCVRQDAADGRRTRGQAHALPGLRARPDCAEGTLVEEVDPPPRRQSAAIQREPYQEADGPRPRKTRGDEVIAGEPPTVLPVEPRRRRRRPVLNDDEEHHPRGKRSGGGSSGMTDKGVLGGLAMMGISIVWLVAGLFFGWLFYKPLILLVIGLVTFIKGLIDGNVFGE